MSTRRGQRRGNQAELERRRLEEQQLDEAIEEQWRDMLTIGGAVDLELLEELEKNPSTKESE